MPLTPETWLYLVISGYNIRRSVGISLLLVPHSIARHCLFVETSNAEAHADMYIRDNTCKETKSFRMQYVCRIIHIHERLCCFAVWQLIWNCQILECQEQSATRTPFLYIDPHPSVPPESGPRSENGYKVTKKKWNDKQLGQLFLQSSKKAEAKRRQSLICTVKNVIKADTLTQCR